MVIEGKVNLFEAKDLVCEVGRRLWQRGYVSANDGNISVRIDNQRLVATPTGVSKGFMRPSDLIVTDMNGQVIQGDRKPSSELKMHLEIYNLRRDVQSVVHAHPPFATAFALAGVALDKCLLPESILSLGAIPIVPYATPSTDEIPSAIRQFIPSCQALLLANHGAVVWADSLMGAYYKMESLEHSATITHHAMSLGEPRVLDEQQVQKLVEVRDKMGLSGSMMPCEASKTCPAEKNAADPSLNPDYDELAQKVTEEVLRALSLRGKK